MTAPLQDSSRTPLTRSTPPTRGVNDYHDLSGRYSIASHKQDRIQQLPFKNEDSLPSFLKYDRKVLCFKAYYEEEVLESTLEKQRVRKCLVYYYLENDTIQMIEPSEENAGMPQGAFIRRHRIPKAEYQVGGPLADVDSPEFYTLNDVYIGAELDVYKKKIKIYDCNAFTRKYLAQFSSAPMPTNSSENNLVCKVATATLPCPEGEYNRVQRLKMQRETGGDLSINRNRRMHPMKSFMEAQLGKPQSVANLGSFLAHDRQVLRFDCIWDDSSQLYGDVLKFKLLYYMSDDTIEILNEKTNGRDPVPRFLSRRKLPLPANALKHAPGTIGTVDESSTQHYTWRHLQLGEHVDVYNRQLLLVNADRFTFSYYQRQFKPLGSPIKLNNGNARFDHIRAPVPPYNGFGSEEDSLRSVYSIRPKKSIRDMPNTENCGKFLRFSIRIKNAKNEDKARMFVLTYYLIDDTLSIRETVHRNSGRMAGSFLRRGRVTKPRSASTVPDAASTSATDTCDPPPQVEYYKASDLFVGAVIELLGHQFAVCEADEYSIRYMEGIGAPLFPYSDLDRVIESIKSNKSSFDRFCAELSALGGKIEDAHSLKTLMEKADLKTIPVHACITLARAARVAEHKESQEGPFSATTLQYILRS